MTALVLQKKGRSNIRPITKTKLIAHRGLSGFECENTAAAFIAAGNQDYFGIETDLRQTADGKFVLLHDHQTERIANTNLVVADTTIAELQDLRLKDLPRMTGETHTHLRIPSLEEYLSICKYYRKTAVLEIKIRLTHTLAQEILNIVKETGMDKNIIIIDFTFDNLVLLRKLAPDMPMQYLTGEYTDSLISRLSEYCLDLDIYYPALDQEIASKLKESGILINVWTVDDLATAKKFAEWGVDFITTNRILSL